MHRGKHARPTRFTPFLVLLLLVAVVSGWRFGWIELRDRPGGLAAASVGHSTKKADPGGAAPGGYFALPTPRVNPSVSPDQQAAALERLARLGLPVYCGGRSRPFVALTFDDGPGPYTLATIDLLRSFGDTATFFLVGKELRAYPTLLGLPRVEARFAAVGDHTWSHPRLIGLALSILQHEIGDTQLAIARATGKPVLLFRPPFGALDRTVERYVQSLGMVDIVWTVDSLDSQGASPSQVLRNVEKGLRPGAIILMHENRGSTFSVLPSILRAVSARGLQAVTLPTLLTLDPPTMAQLRTRCGV